MKSAILFWLLNLALTVQAQNPDLFQKRIYISSKGDSLPYRILYPENYDKTKTYPLVLFLHGGGERGNDNEKQLIHGSKLFLDANNRKKFPCIVLFPQCPSSSYWASVKIDRSVTPLSLDFDYSRDATPALKSAIELVRKIIRNERANPSKIYVMGLSMGGMGTFEAVYRCPKLFAAAVPICGGGDSLRYDKRIKKIKFWVFHGDKDAVVDVQNSRKMVARLGKLEVPVKYTEYPDVNHNSWDYALAEPELLSWLFSHKR